MTRHKNSKLTAKQEKAIQAAPKEISNAALATRYNVSPATIGKYRKVGQEHGAKGRAETAEDNAGSGL